MNKEERIRELAYDLNFGVIYSSWISYEDPDLPSAEVEIDCEGTAEGLVNKGYHKTVWHKVAEGDLPTNNQEIRWLDNTNNYYNGIYCGGDAQQFHADVGCYFDREEVVAWTELPMYKEN